MPAQLVPSVAKAFHVDCNAMRRAAFVRCDRATLLGCFIGANLACGKADTRRELSGTSARCRARPVSRFIPMFAIGHATIYVWSCADHRAVAGKVVQPVDARGYVAANCRKIQ